MKGSEENKGLFSGITNYFWPSKPSQQEVEEKAAREKAEQEERAKQEAEKERQQHDARVKESRERVEAKLKENEITRAREEEEARQREVKVDARANDTPEERPVPKPFTATEEIRALEAKGGEQIAKGGADRGFRHSDAILERRNNSGTNQSVGM